jgi:hypothetical protein
MTVIKNKYHILGMICILIVVTLMFRILSLRSSSAVTSEWERVLILSHRDTPSAVGAHNLFPADFTGDDQVELVGISFVADAAILFNYNNEKGSYNESEAWNWQILFWPVRNSLDPHFRRSNMFAHFLDVGDINGNGCLDIIIPLHTGKPDIVWLENPCGIDALDPIKWKKHELFNWDSGDEPAAFAYEARLVDADGDCDLDVVVSSKQGGDLYLIRNPLNEPWGGEGAVRQSWGNQIFLHHDPDSDWNSPNRYGWTFSAAVGQITGYGPEEIVGGIRGKGVYYWTYVGDGVSEWLEDQWVRYPISEVLEGGVDGYFLDIFDIDGDGWADIITETKNPTEGDIAIFRNPGRGLNTYWDYNIIDNVVWDGRQFSVGDINKDGHNDIVVACASINELVWYENSGPTWYDGWEKHHIDKHPEYTEYAHFVELFDIDGDGKLDILYATCPVEKGYFIIYFNRLLTEENEEQITMY